MKLSVRMACLFASSTFLMVALPGFYQKSGFDGLFKIQGAVFSWVDMMEMLLFSLFGALISAIIGYQIGEILTNPKGNRRKRNPPPSKKPKPVSTRLQGETASPEEASLPPDVPQLPSGEAGTVE
jgi:hypothetical protein